MSNKSLQNTRIEFHILQSFPVTCLNRDDVGAPKTAVIGGTIRARVSSQCWKRQVRLAMPDFGVKLAIRTKHVAEYVGEACAKLGASPEQAEACGKKIADALTKDTLHFFSDSEAQAFAEFAQKQAFDSEKLGDKEIHKIAKNTLNPALDALDIALFGRMVAQAAELNIEAAASFAHAISTHKVNNEVEFFTALDDLKPKTDSGSAHMGSLEFNSATYYRYVSLDLGQLNQTLKGLVLPEAIEAFTRALFIAIPAARQATQSGASGWEYAKVFVRKGQRLQVPFETAVKSEDGGFLRPSIKALKSYIAEKEKLWGTMFNKQGEYDFGENGFGIDELVAALKKHVE